MSICKNHWLYAFLAGLCLTIVLTMNPSNSVTTIKDVTNVWFYPADQWIPFVMWIGSSVAIYYGKQNFPTTFIHPIWALLGACIWIVGRDITYTTHLFRGSIQKASLLLFIGTVLFAFVAVKAILPILIGWMESLTRYEEKESVLSSSWKQFFWMMTPILSVRVLFLGAMNPGNMTFDSFSVLSQATGMSYLTNSHPFLYTKLLGVFTTIGDSLFHSVGKGIFLFSLMSVLFTSVVWTVTLQKVFTFTTNRVIKGILYGLYAFHPYFIVYSFSIYKDVFLVNFLLLFTIAMIEILYHPENFFTKWQWTLLWVVSFVGIFEMHRKAVIYLVVSIIALLIFQKQQRKAIWIRSIVAAVVTIVIHLSSVWAFHPYPSIKQYDYLATRFQQVATVMKTSPQTFTEEEQQVYDKLFRLRRLSMYNSQTSDPIKAKVTNAGFKKYQATFWKMWAKGYLRHPKAYLEAVLNLSVSYWYPYRYTDPVYTDNYYDVVYGNRDKDWQEYFQEYVEEKRNGLPLDEGWSIQNNEIKRKRTIVAEYLIHSIGYVPGLGAIAIPGFYTLFFLLLCYASIRHKKKELYPFLCVIASVILSCIYSPAVAYFRYSYVFMVLIPLCVPLFVTKMGSYKRQSIIFKKF